MGVCDARAPHTDLRNTRKYTCEECVQGLEWVEAYLEDPIMTAEFTVYLQQNFCTNEMGPRCHEASPPLPCDARHGHGEVLHPSGDLQPGACMHRGGTYKTFLNNTEYIQ